MKLFVLSPKTLLYLSVVFLFSCSKKNDSELKSDIDLRDQPLQVVQRYAVGRFQLIYTKTGVSVDSTKDDSIFIEISPQHILWKSKSSVIYDSNISWVAITTINQRNAFDMVIDNGTNFPARYYPQKVQSNILILSDNAFDGTGYFLRRL